MVLEEVDLDRVPARREVDLAGDDLVGVQAVVVPGKGVAACQAAVDSTHANQMLVFQELEKGTDPRAIIDLLSKDPAFQSRQFGILDLQGRSAGHSGLTNGYVSQDMQGQVPGTEIFYSIQGNILRPGNVVPSAVKAFISAKGGITDRVMAAMEAADRPGAVRARLLPAGSTGPLPARGLAHGAADGTDAGHGAGSGRDSYIMPSVFGSQIDSAGQ